MPIAWTAALATGVRQIDLQHQELIDLINELDAAHVAGRQADALDGVLPRLAAYVLFHFGTEEALMAETDGAAAHAALHAREHRLFAERVVELRADPGDLAGFIDYLKGWLIGHIMKTDHDLAALIRSGSGRP